MIYSIDWTGFAAPIILSIKVSLVSSIFVFLLGIAAARFMAFNKFVGKSVVETLFMLPLVLPPTVVGFLLLVALGRKSWIGQIYERLFDQTIVFTWSAAAIASVVVAFPLVYRTIKAGFESVNKDLLDSARSIGANEGQVLRWITIPLSLRSLLTAYILGFARSLGEFGATLMVAGNIPGKTQTTPTAIYIAVDAGNMTLAWMWVGSLMVISFLMIFITNKKID